MCKCGPVQSSVVGEEVTDTLRILLMKTLISELIIDSKWSKVGVRPSKSPNRRCEEILSLVWGNILGLISPGQDCDRVGMEETQYEIPSIAQTILHCPLLHCTSLHCTALHYTALHFTALHCTALHCHCRVTTTQ